MTLLLPPLGKDDLILVDLIHTPKVSTALPVQEYSLENMLLLTLPIRRRRPIRRLGLVRQRRDVSQCRGRLGLASPSGSVLRLAVELGLVVSEVETHLDLLLVGRVRSDEVERLEAFFGESELSLSLCVVVSLRRGHRCFVLDIVVLLHVVDVRVRDCHVPKVLRDAGVSTTAERVRTEPNGTHLDVSEDLLLEPRRSLAQQLDRSISIARKDDLSLLARQ